VMGASVLPQGFTFFCDDIRPEIGGKITIAGVYTGTMIVASEYPIALPKFCLLIYYQEPVDADWDDLKIAIHMPGQEEPITQTIPLSQLRGQVRPPPSHLPMPEDAEPQRAWQIPVGFAPFVITQEGYIKVRGHYGDRVLKMGSLAIVRASEAGQPSAEAIPMTPGKQ
jgi:hypothetical protein